MQKKTWANLTLTLIGALITSIWTCTIPPDPFSPSNTRLSIVLESGTVSSEDKGTFSDTLGVTLRVGIAIDLTQNVESARLSIECTNPDFDTTVLYSDFSSLDTRDTVWLFYTYQDTGKIVIHTDMAVRSWETVTDSVVLTVYARTNHAPRLIVSGERSVEAGMPCSLSFGANDPDAVQKLSFSIDTLPGGAEFDADNYYFNWIPESADTGTHQFIFKVVDNGFPSLSDEDTVMVTVTPAKEYHAPEWESDTVQKSIQAGALLEIDLTEICSDADGDSIAFALIEGDPSDDTVTTSTYSWEPAEEDTGTFYVTIIAEYPSSMTDTVVMELMVSLQDVTPPSLTLVSPDDSSVTATDTVTATVTCKDLSGVEYVRCKVGSDTFEVRRNDTLYTATVTGLQGGEYTTIMFTAADESDNHNTDTLLAHVKLDNDTDVPVVARVTPDNDSVSTNSSSYTITLACDDASDIDSVLGTMGEATFTGSFDTENEWVITVDDLEEGLYNEVTITVTDASLRANSTSLSIYIMYDPTMDDVDSPTLQRVSGLASGDIVTSDVIARVDSIYDPSGIDSVYWILGGKVKIMTPVTTSKTGGTYALQDTLRQYHLDTLEIVVVDASTAHNRTNKHVVVDFNVPPVVRDTAIATYLATRVTVTPTVTSADDDNVTLRIIVDPEHGTAEVDGAELTYTPEGGFYGEDSFDIAATDNVWRDTMRVKVTVAPTYTLTVNRTATEGTVTVEKDTTVYYDGDDVVLTATPTAGYRFTRWSGDTTTTENPLTITVRKNRTVTAQYVKTYTLTLLSSDTDKGVVSTTAGISPVTVDSGVAVAIKATAADGYTFKEWSTTGSGVNLENLAHDSTTVTLTGGDATVTGEFGCVTFAKKLGFTQYANMDLNDVVQTEDGNYLAVAGNGGTSMLLVKLDADGDTVWTKTTTDIVWPRSITRASNRYLVSGRSSQGPAIASFAQNGTTDWARDLPASNSSIDGSGEAVRVRRISDGGYVTGISTSSAFSYRMIKIEESLIFTSWDTMYSVGRGTSADFMPARDGGFIFVGSATGNASLHALKTDENGELVWDRDFSPTTDITYSITSFSSIDTTDDGGFMIAGGFRAVLEKGFLMKLDSRDSVSVKAVYDDLNEIVSVRVLGNGDCMIAGKTSTLSPAGNGEDIYIARTGPTGSILSDTTFGNTNDEGARSLQLTSDGGAIAVGSGNWIIKTDENGQVD